MKRCLNLIMILILKDSDVQAQSIDLDESGSSPVRRKLDEKQLEFIREAFAQYRSDRTRQKSSH